MQTSFVGAQTIWTVVDFSYAFKFPDLGETVKRLDLVISFCGNINLGDTEKKCVCYAVG